MGNLADIKVVPDSQEVEVQQDDGEAFLLLNPIFFLFFWCICPGPSIFRGPNFLNVSKNGILDGFKGPKVRTKKISVLVRKIFQFSRESKNKHEN